MARAIQYGMRQGYGAWKKDALVPMDNTDAWDDYENRLYRYHYYWHYYNNTVYKDIAKFSGLFKTEEKLYSDIRGIYNPVARLAQAYVSMVYGGNLDYEDLTEGAMPISKATPQLRAAISQIWRWSNWGNKKSLYVRRGTVLGDTFIKVVDDTTRRKVYMEVLHPAKVKEIELDNVDNVKSYVIEYAEKVWEGTKEVTYTRTEVGDGTLFSTYRNGHSYAYGVKPDGTAVDHWENEYGFIPLVMTKHEDLGQVWGANAFHTELSKIDEINDAASMLNDQIRKTINAMWYLAGVKKGDKTLEVDIQRGKIPFIYGPKDSQPFAMVASIDLGAAASNIKDMIAESEKSMPELALYVLRTSGGATAPGVRTVFSDAIGRIREARANYDAGIVRAHMMCVSIGGYQEYDGFESFSEDSYRKGDLEHQITDRAVLEDTIGLQEELNLLKDSGAPLWLILNKLKYPRDVIDKVVEYTENRRSIEANLMSKVTNGQIPEEQDGEGDNTDFALESE